MGELPVFTCQAHVFSINPQTKKSWIPASSKAVDVNFFFDSNKQCYRIISVEDGSGGKKVIINSTLTEKMTFKKTSQKFGQWADSKSGAVHGLGFNSESELSDFITHFKQYVEASKGSKCSTTASNGRPTDTSVSATVTVTNLDPSSQIIGASASLGPPAPVSIPSSLTLMNPSVPPISQLPSSAPIVTNSAGLFDVSGSHSGYHLAPTLTQVQLQQQLRHAQNQIRRLEEELHVTRRQASSLGIQSATNFRPSTAAETISSAMDGSLHPANRTTDIPDLRDCLSRLELNGALMTNGAGENCGVDGSSATLVHCLTPQFPEPPANKPPRATWTVDAETIRTLHTRLGHILQEAVDLHNRLGALLP